MNVNKFNKDYIDKTIIILLITKFPVLLNQNTEVLLFVLFATLVKKKMLIFLWAKFLFSI